MSSMIPQATVDVLRKFGDVSVDLYGISCTLYIPNNLSTVEKYDVYDEIGDYSYDEYTTKVWIEWSPNIRRLRRYGFFTEEDIPIVARFGRTATNTLGAEVQVDVVVRSYIKVPIQYIPNSYSHTDEFEVVDTLIGNVHDAVTNKLFRLAPRRSA